MHHWTRRHFLAQAARLGVGAAALGAGLGAGVGSAGCGGPVRTTRVAGLRELPVAPSPPQIAMAFHPLDAVAADVCEAVIPTVDDLSWLKPGDSVFVKVACNSPNPHPAVTWPHAVSGLVVFLKNHGAKEVLVGDQAGVEHVRLTASEQVSGTRQAMAQNGLLAAIEASPARGWCFDEHGFEAGYRQATPPGAHSWEDRLWLPTVLSEVDHVVNLTRLSTHALAGYTAGVKNAVGWLRDDSRLHLHREGAHFFELLAELNEAPPLVDKLRFTLTLGDHALLNIGPDFGSRHALGGVMALCSRDALAHDLLAAALLRWLDGADTSIFDLYSPYPEHSDYWNRRLVGNTWGGEQKDRCTPLVAPELARGLAFDPCLSRLASLRGERPTRITLRRTGVGWPEALLPYLDGYDGGIFAA